MVTKLFVQPLLFASPVYWPDRAELDREGRLDPMPGLGTRT